MKKYRIHKISHSGNIKAAIFGGAAGSMMTAIVGGMLFGYANAGGMAVFDATNYAKNASVEVLSKENLAILTSLTDAVGEVAPSILNGAAFSDTQGGALEGITQNLGGWEELSGVIQLATPFLEDELGGLLAGTPITGADATQIFRSVFSAASGTETSGPAPSELMVKMAAENVVKRAWVMKGASDKRMAALGQLLALAKAAAAKPDEGGGLRSQEAINSAIMMNQTQAINELHTTMSQLAELMAMEATRELQQGRKPGAKGTWPNPDAATEAASAPASAGSGAEWKNPDENPDVFGG